MKTRLIVTLIAICQVALLCSAVAQAADPLRWKFTAGERLRYDMTQQMENNVDAGVGGQLTTKVEQIMNMFWTVKEVSPEGNATIVQSFDRIRMKMLIPGAAGLEYDSNSEDPPAGLAALIAPVFNALKKAEITVVMAPTGEVLETKVPDELIDALKNAPGAQMMGDMASKEGLQQMTGAASMKFPETPLEVGQKITSTVEMKNPMMGKLIVVSTQTYKGPVTVSGEEFERFEPGMKMSIGEPDDAEKPQAAPRATRPTDVKFSDQSSEGELLFDREKGRLSSMNVTQKYTIEMKVNDRQVKSQIEQKIEVAVKPIGIVAP